MIHQLQIGSVELTDSISEWIDFECADTVTARMLLNHASGIAN